MTAEVPPPAPQPDEPEAAPLPGWVPVLIGIVLVLLAALAVFTGLRFRNNTITSIVKTRSTPVQRNAPAPPGEPEPGASLMFPGDSGDTTPTAHPPVTGRSRAVITGGAGSAVAGTVRIWARRGMTTNVTPPDALVYVNDVAVGQATQLATTPYEFPQPGSYTVRITAPGYADRTFVVTASDSAKEEIARIEVKLAK
jgi:hypothetical protein